MTCFGTIPGRTEPMFRIVFAPSIWYLVGGDFTDEDGRSQFMGYRPCPRYDYIGDKWVMEKWVSAKDFTGQTEVEYKAQWEDPQTHLCLTGPYPHSGEWQWVWTFDKPEMIAAHGIVAALVNRARLNSKAANAAALRDTQKAAKKQKRQTMYDQMKDKMRVAGIRAANIGGRVKALKSRPSLIDASTLGLPTRGGQIKATGEEMAVAGF
jgi:hypothetical protein